MVALAYEHLEDPVFKRLGIAQLTQRAFQGEDLIPLITELLIENAKNPDDAGVLMDLSMLEQLRGNLNDGLFYQAKALRQSPLYSIKTEQKTKIRVLVLAAPIRMGGNTPIEFLLDGSDIEILTLFVGPNLPLPETLPPHDLTFIAAPGDSDENRLFLDEIALQTQDWPTPILNAPDAIRGLERDVLCENLAGIQGLVCPITIKSSRAVLENLGMGIVQIDDLYPCVIRPVGSHAGRGMERLDSAGEIPAYLAKNRDTDFFVTQYADYRSDDGQYRKYRIVFVAGEPFACHMAIADQWKLWYMNAEMGESPSKLAEERNFMENFQSDFADRHRSTLNDISERIGLEYFGIDCAETRDGELLIFEADNSLIVHDMDPKDIFPYKSATVQKIFSAVQDMLHVGAKHSAKAD